MDIDDSVLVGHPALLVAGLLALAGNVRLMHDSGEEHKAGLGSLELWYLIGPSGGYSEHHT